MVYTISSPIRIRTPACPTCGVSRVPGVGYPTHWVVVCDTCHRRGPPMETVNGEKLEEPS